MARILVVEDDRALSPILAEFLRARGHEALEVGSGKEALAIARLHRFDMVFLDIVMPGMDGIETLRRLKAEFPAIVVVMISGISDEQTATRSLELGAFDYIRKPFDLHALNRVVWHGLALAA